MTINLNDYIGTSAAIPLAKQGEFGREVSFDFSAWVEMFGPGSIGWSIQRPQDTSAYLLPSTEDGTVSTITLTETESQYSGYGLLEVFYVNTGETEKRISNTFSFRIDKSLQNLGAVPSPWQSYVDAVHEDAVKAEEASQSILDLTASATVDSSVGTPSVSIEVSTEDDHKNMAFAFSNIKGEQGEQGETGNGISSVSVEKTATVGNVDTYTMTISYTDGDSDTATFDITNSEVTEEEFLKAFPVDVAQGSIASYPDGADLPVKDLKVSVEPVQDLHGYANPWPSGGRKNKFGGEYNEYFPLYIPSGTVVCAYSDVTSSINYYKADGETRIDYWSVTSSGRVFTLSEDAYYFRFTGASPAPTKMYIAIENSFSGYVPYSNICPITGWTGANVVRTGVNLWDGTYEANKWLNNSRGEITNANGYNLTDYIPVRPNTTYYHMASGSIRGLQYDADKNVVDTGGWGTGGNGGGTFTTNDNTRYVRMTITTVNLETFSINYPSTDHDYHAYVGNTYPFTFGQTVYGGTLDVTTGVLTIEKAMVTYNGNPSNVWTKDTTNNYFNTSVTVSDAVNENSSPNNQISNLYPYGAVANGNSTTGLCLIWGRIRVRLADMSISLDDWNTMLSATPLQVVYKLASPQSVQLTATEVKSLLGQNNIFADCGNSEVEYRADVTLYIQKLTGSTEDDMVANQNIANNKYFLVGSRLFFSTSAIAQGASIIVGTNCTETNLADALNALNS